MVRGQRARRSHGRDVSRARMASDVLLPLVGIGLTGVGWWFLVRAAIAFATTARGGESVLWGYAAAATLGAVVCLALVLLLVLRLLAVVGLIDRYRPRRSSRAGRDKAATAEAASRREPPATSP